MRTYRLIILIAFAAACKATAPMTAGSYSEDLSIHRPVASVEVPETGKNDDDQVINENFKPLYGHLKAEMDSIAKVAYAQNKAGKLVDGYVIQVYSGNSRETANDARMKMYELFPELEAKISYHQPNFRVKGGKFTNRLEAHRIYNLVKEEFPRALLLPERFKIAYE
ncbi:MAG: hypothetical protein Tsb0034_04630 [Ekhidna sp.]